MRNWENIRYYLAVARSGTVSAAAVELGVSHATVLRRIEQLEEELDARLFKKLQSGYELTAEGEKLLDNALSVETDIHDMLRRFQGQKQQTGGKLRVSQPESDILDVYTHYAEFSRLYPDITLEIHSTMDVHNLNRHEADVAIRITDNPPDLLIGRCLGCIGYGAYASKQYLQQFESPYQLNQMSWIVWQNPQVNKESEWLAKHVAEPKIVLYTTSMSDVISAVRVGMGAGLMSHQTARLYPDLVHIPNTEGDEQFAVWILTHRDLRNTTRVKTFIQFMAESLRQQLLPV